MSNRAYRMPVELAAATKIGPRLFRKTVLRSGLIKKNGVELDVTPEYLRGLVENFTAGAMDNVPLVIGHPGMDEVEKTRGRLQGLEVQGDELVGTFEADDCAELLDKHPYIGCSVAIDPEFSRADGRRFGPSLVHVGMHNDPEVSKLGDWVPLGSEYDEVIDLTDDTPPTPAETGVGSREEGAPVATLTEEQISKLLKLIEDGGETPAVEENKTEEEAAEAEGESTEAVQGELFTEAELDEIAKPAEEEVVAEERELVSAGNDDVEHIELANTVKKQELQLAAVIAERDAERWNTESASLTRDFGLPRDVVELAKPLLFGKGHVVNLGRGEEKDAGEVMRSVLHELGRRYKALLALGEEFGTADAIDDTTKRDNDLDSFVARAHAELGTHKK